MQWIDLAKFPFGLPFTENGGKPAEHWTKILFGDALKMWGASATAAHHFGLHDPRVKRVIGDVIEMGARIGQDFFFRRQIARKDFSNCCDKAAKDLIEYGVVECFLVFEVVIEQGLIDAGGAGDGIGACAGRALAGELTHGRIEDGGTAFLGSSSGTHPRFGRCELHFRH